MNFADIRDMERTQGLFWAVAVPVTAGIIVLAVFLANHGDRVLELVILFVQRLKNGDLDSGSSLGSGKSGWNSSATVLPQMQSVQRRRRFLRRR
jgi:hypothetical protein